MMKCKISSIIYYIVTFFQLPDHRLNKCPIEECANMDCSKKVFYSNNSTISVPFLQLDRSSQEYNYYTLGVYST